MTVYADTPRWPRHGTVWGHMISDASLEELHDAAARAGLPGRAYDLDHYDWPLSSRADLEAAGVVFVGDRELTRILLRSGLRIPLRDRPAARAERTARDLRAIGADDAPSSESPSSDALPPDVLPSDPAPSDAPIGGGLLRPRDFLWGTLGHADPLPPAEAVPVGSFRMTCDGAQAEPRVEAHDDEGRADAARWAAHLHRLARAAGRPEGFVGQLLVVPGA
ncbi:DUF4031 domain-containing protein [Brachybacterium sp. DNPG3]